ncbi:MAG: hypothetical protein K0S74_1283 [Chlamydiales bacterium]|jgi:hypothetical protein|nr:hypothetical protein [Chlamydiales bacterium]
MQLTSANSFAEPPKLHHSDDISCMNVQTNSYQHISPPVSRIFQETISNLICSPADESLNNRQIEKHRDPTAAAKLLWQEKFSSFIDLSINECQPVPINIFVKELLDGFDSTELTKNVAEFNIQPKKSSQYLEFVINDLSKNLNRFFKDFIQSKTSFSTAQNSPTHTVNFTTYTEVLNYYNLSTRDQKIALIQLVNLVSQPYYKGYVSAEQLDTWKKKIAKTTLYENFWTVNDPAVTSELAKLAHGGEYVTFREKANKALEQGIIKALHPNFNVDRIRFPALGWFIVCYHNQNFQDSSLTWSLLYKESKQVKEILIEKNDKGIHSTRNLNTSLITEEFTAASIPELICKIHNQYPQYINQAPQAVFSCRV